MADKTEILVEALKQIASYGKDGICPYGCDTPYIAIKALVDFGNKEYVEWFTEHSNEGRG